MSQLTTIHCSSLSFTLHLSPSNSLLCYETHTRLRVPVTITGPISPLSTYWARFVPRSGLELRPKLLGGGCCQSSPTRLSEIRDLQTIKKINILQNQRLAQEIADETRNFAYSGLTTGLRLSQLDDLPQVSINNPLSIAESLLEALGEDGLWTVESDFLLRQTVARVMRREFLDHLFGNRGHFGEIVKEKIRKPVKGIRKRMKMGRGMESGVRVELAALKEFTGAAQDPVHTWSFTQQSKPLIGRAYVLPRPLHSPPSLDQVRGLFPSHPYDIQLLIDDLYFQATPDNLSSLLRIACFLLEPGPGKTWKIHYQALSFIEWCFHRELISPEQGETVKMWLKPFLTVSGASEVAGGNGWRLCEKVTTLLMKAAQQNVMLELLAYIATSESDPRIQHLLSLPTHLLRLDIPASLPRNLPVLPCLSLDSSLQHAKSLLSTHQTLSLTGQPGVGKTYFAISLSQTYEIAWLCPATSLPVLYLSLRVLAGNLGVRFDGLQTALEGKKAVIILDNAVEMTVSRCLELVPGSCKVITTSREALCDTVVELQPMDSGLSAKLCEWLGENEVDMGELVGVEGEERERRVVERWVREMKTRFPAGYGLLEVVARLAQGGEVEELYEPVFRHMHPSDSYPSSKSLLDSFFPSTLHHAYLLPSLLPSSLPSSPTLFPILVSISELLFTDDSLSDANLKLALAVQKLVSEIQNKENVELVEMKLCLKWTYFCVEKLKCGENVGKLLEQICVWYRLNPRGLDSMELPVPYYIGTCFKRLGDLQRAAEYFLLEVVTCEKTLPQYHPDLAFAYELLSSTYYQLHNYPAAELFQQKCLFIRHQTTPLASSYRLFSSILHAQNKLKEAEKALFQAIPLANSTEKPDFYSDLAAIYSEMGNFEAAKRYQLQSLRLDEAENSGNRLNLAISYSNLANIYRNMGKFNEAIEFQAKSIKIKEEILKNDDILLGISYNSMAKINISLKNLSLAHFYQLKALKIEKNEDFLHTMAEIEANLGDFEGAKEKFRLEIAIRREKMTENEGWKLGIAYFECGKLELEEKKYELSRENLEKAAFYMEKTVSKENGELQECYRLLTLVYEELGERRHV